LRCTLPTVVTLHDLVPLKRPGEYLRFKLRYLAVQRATRVIVPTITSTSSCWHSSGHWCW
jgi:hypothetical protein